MQKDHNNRLLGLLDFSQVQNEGDVFEQAQKIAEELLLNWQIKSNERSLFSIEAIEFYLIIPDVFEDDANAQPKGATHGRPEQLSQGKFYVHTKSKKGWTLPTFNRHGIDITCGKETRGSDDKTKGRIYGGILLRHIGGQDHKDGSGRALRVLLRGEAGHKTIAHESDEHGWSDEEKEILEKLNQSDIFENDLGIELVYSPRPKEERVQIVSGRRIGIEETRFADAKLRFFLV